MLANAQALSVLFALLSCKIPAHLFAKPPTEVHNARQCSGIVCAFRLVELQSNGSSIRKLLAMGYHCERCVTLRISLASKPYIAGRMIKRIIPSRLYTPVILSL
jgi:hypothetical protein